MGMSEVLSSVPGTGSDVYGKGGFGESLEVQLGVQP